MEEMTYSESANGQMITAERVTQELARHGIDDMETVLECFGELIAYETHAPAAYEMLHGLVVITCTCGARECSTPSVTLYDAGDVLNFLGY